MLFFPKNYKKTGDNNYSFSGELLNISYKNIEINTVKNDIEKELEFEYSIEKILQTFSNAEISWHEIRLEAGVIESIDLLSLKQQNQIPQDYEVFAVRLPSMITGNIDLKEHLIPYVYRLDKTHLRIGSSSHKTSPKNFKTSCSFSIYFNKPYSSLWEEVLYKSLFEFS